MRSDGTYGPILGTSFELSHYFKFKAIADGLVPLPSVYPMLPNPAQDHFKNLDAQYLNKVFNLCYSILVEALEDIFGKKNEADNQSSYFRVVVTLMHSVIPALSTQLMQTPILKNGHATLGPTAGPSYEYTATKTTIQKALQNCKEKINKILNDNKKELSSPTIATLEGVKNAIDRIDDPNSKQLTKILVRGEHNHE